MDLKKLAEPFPPSDIEWRVGRAGTKEGSGPWATVLAYLTNRAIMQRLDDVCGPENWRNEYRYEAGGAVLCGLSILTESGWVTKWDGAENTDIEKVKGGLSNAMKRAAVQWGMGRYLYDLEEGFAKVSANGKHYQPAKKENNGKPGYPAFKWDPPSLPAWALPSGAKNGAAAGQTTTNGTRRASAEEGTVQPPATPSAVATRPASTEKVSEGMKLNGIRMATMSTEELEKLVAEKGGDLKYAKHITEAKRILASRSMEAKFAAEVAEQEASLPF